MAFLLCHLSAQLHDKWEFNWMDVCSGVMNRAAGIPSHFTRRILQVIHPVFSRFTDFLPLLIFSKDTTVSVIWRLRYSVQKKVRNDETKESGEGGDGIL